MVLADDIFFDGVCFDALQMESQVSVHLLSVLWETKSKVEVY